VSKRKHPKAKDKTYLTRSVGSTLYSAATQYTNPETSTTRKFTTSPPSPINNTTMQNFAIEVSGEANPLTEHTLLNVLRSAASTDPQQVQSGAKQLERWEKVAGFYKYLQSVFIDKSLPFEVRYLAIIQVKNGIEKYWRKTAAK
jgi:hypothetical protein